MPNDNGKNPPLPPKSLHFERSPVICQRCKREFAHFILEEIDDLVQLRCGDVLIARTEMTCLHCGAMFYWNIREKNLEKMTLTYSELMLKINGYTPE